MGGNLMLHLSKSIYCSAVQCPKMLWMKKNMPEAFDESVVNQAILDRGNEIGDLAMGLFGDYVEVPFGDLGEMIQRTESLIEVDFDNRFMCKRHHMVIDITGFGQAKTRCI